MNRFNKTLALHSALIVAGVRLSTAAPADGILELHTRSRSDAGVLERVVYWKAAQTAIIVCDMWDQNWCKGATARAAAMVPRMNAVLKAAREAGVTIIHAPSGTMEFYRGAAGRKLVLSAPSVQPPFPIPKWINPDPAREGPYPIDDSDGGCDDTPRCTMGEPWKRQLAALQIADGDGISDDGQEIYSYLHGRGVRNVVLMGVHMNFCVLGRPFGIRAQRLLGMNVALARDLTDALYNHRMPPHVSREEGVNLMVAHIEWYWAPSILSDDLMRTTTGVEPTEYIGSVSFAPPGGIFFTKNIPVRMGCAAAGTEIRYTLDEGTPGEHSNLYSSPLTLARTSVVKARAYKKGAIESDLTEAEFVFADSTHNGLRYRYYEGAWKILPDFDRLSPLAEGYAYGLNPSLVKRRPDGFGIVYSGYLSIPTPGMYTFALTSDDGSRLFVDGQLLIDNDGQHAAERKVGIATLQAGLQPLRIVYFSVVGANAESLSLEIQGPSGTWHRVTGDMFYRAH